MSRVEGAFAGRGTARGVSKQGVLALALCAGGLGAAAGSLGARRTAHAQQRGPAASASAGGENAPRARLGASGRPVVFRHPSCGMFATPDAEGAYLHALDIRPPPAQRVRGDDLLAITNRGPQWTLGPDYAPSDLVELNTLQPIRADECNRHGRKCLRREAAQAYRSLVQAWARAGHTAFLDSAYRGYATQCFVFGRWAYHERHGFCRATHGSALPGHSQHQLGTVIDLFTSQWASSGQRFRNGFGCTPAGRWLAEHAHEHGWVLSYPLHPDLRVRGSDCLDRGDLGVDPRTGYTYEPWHYRYIGVENARRYTAARAASGVGTANELTLEQWLRAQANIPGPIDPPVCDGCSCEHCATLAPAGEGPCGDRGLRIGADGRPVPASAPPTLVDAQVTRAGGVVRVRVTVEAPANTLTQPPIVTESSRVVYPQQGSYHALAGIAGGLERDYADVPGAWRVAVGPAGARDLPWRAALVEARRSVGINGINGAIPAALGRVTVTVPVAGVPAGTALQVALVRGGTAVQARALTAP